MDRTHGMVFLGHVRGPGVIVDIETWEMEAVMKDRPVTPFHCLRLMVMNPGSKLPASPCPCWLHRTALGAAFLDHMLAVVKRAVDDTLAVEDTPTLAADTEWLQKKCQGDVHEYYLWLDAWEHLAHTWDESHDRDLTRFTASMASDLYRRARLHRLSAAA